MGLAIATVGGVPRLYAADLAQNRIDMSSTPQWQLIDAPAAFVDPNLPAGYGAYGVQTVGNRIIVTYARQPAGDAGQLPGDPRRRASASSTRSTCKATSSRGSRARAAC